MQKRRIAYVASGLALCAVLGVCLSPVASAGDAPSVAPQETLTPHGLIFSLSAPVQRLAQSDSGQPDAGQVEKGQTAKNEEAIARRIKETLARKLPSLLARDQDRSAMARFYEKRNRAPIWVSQSGANQRANDAAALLRSVAVDGLDPADYPIPEFGVDEDKLAESELILSASVVRFARHASTGRVAFSRVSGSIFFEQHALEAEEVLHKVSAGDSPTIPLETFHPQVAEYKALKKQLAALRALLPGTQAKEDDVTASVKGSKTKRKRINSVQPKSAETQGAQSKIDSVIANMERWRWMPRDLGSNHVLVNIPNYTLTVRHDGQDVWSTKIVVGKPGEQATPLLSAAMKSITVNPTWNVPPSIIRKEYLPALSRDPDALSRMGLKMGRNKDGSIKVFQPPGEKNALGRIRFNFPNTFLVYHHDTPNKHLFAKAERAFSHGCMRVQNPEQYAEMLVRLSQPEDNLTAARVRSYFGDNERTISLKRPLQVHLS